MALICTSVEEPDVREDEKSWKKEIFNAHTQFPTYICDPQPIKRTHAHPDVYPATWKHGCMLVLPTRMFVCSCNLEYGRVIAGTTNEYSLARPGPFIGSIWHASDGG